MSSSTTTNSKRLVIINQASLLKNLSTDKSSQPIRTISLFHSKSKELRPFLVVADQIFELVTYCPEIGSVFVDEYVQSECSICLASRFDFIYFLISMSRLVADKFSSLEHLRNKLIELSTTNSSCLDGVAMPNEELLTKVFDTQEGKEGLEIRFNEAKCIGWLASKVKAVEEYLVGGVSAEGKSKMEAFEILCQYLDKEICEPLRKELGLGSPLVDTDNMGNMKRAKVEVKTEITI